MERQGRLQWRSTGSSEQAGGMGKGEPGSDAQALRICGRCGLCSMNNENPARAAHVDM